MPRLLPVVGAQVSALSPSQALTEIREGLLSRCTEFPSTRLVVYPEFHTCQVSGLPDERRRHYEEIAEPLDGPRVTGLRDLAAEAGVWLVPGTVVERGPAGEMFNTALAISPSGELVAAYRKIFPWRPFEPFDAGSEFVTFDIPEVGRVGLAVCYDLWFPEVIRQLAFLGAELVILPTQTSTCDREQELVLARAAAIHNQLWVLSLNAAEPAGTGRSILVDPQGVVRFQAPSEAPGDFTDVIDFATVAATRTYGTAGLNRMWSQFRDGDPTIALPLYGGAIEPSRWGAGFDNRPGDL